MEKRDVARRVALEAEAVLEAEGRVSYLDILLRLLWLDGTNVGRWSCGMR